MKSKLIVADIPSSWAVCEWSEKAPHVWPNETAKARRVIYDHQEELIACGALTRIDRKKVIIGAGWVTFMMKGVQGVKNFKITPNDPARLEERRARRQQREIEAA